MTRHPVLATLLATVFATACGASSSESGATTPPAGQAVIVLTAPTEGDIEPGATMKFSAQVTGTAQTSVTWTVAEADGGTIDPTGLYTAPTNEGTFHVRANSAIASVKSNGTSVVRVKKNSPGPPISVAISINPATATLDACKGQVFTATVTNTSNTDVTWTVTEAGGGTVTNGIYTAPSAAGTYHVVARSVADPTKTVQGTITVGPEKIVSMAVAPGSGTVQANATLAFAATVTTTCGTFAAQ
jgi:hypothetical protein